MRARSVDRPDPPALQRVLQVREPRPPWRKPRLFEVYRGALRTRHYSRETERAYIHWARQYIRYHGGRHPRQMGEEEIAVFLTHLAVDRKVAASTQNQALSALLFLYRVVLDRELERLDRIARAKRPVRLPVVMTREEVVGFLDHLGGVHWLVAAMLYGSGLRLLECLHLRVKDLDFSRLEVSVRDGKGGKDRRTMRAEALVEPLQRHLEKVERQHREDVARGAGYVELPRALAAKYPNAPREWCWQWVFPATRIYRDRKSGHRRRHHLHASGVQRAVREARIRSRIPEDLLPHPQALLRNPPPGRRLRYPHHPGAPGTPEHRHHHDLHPRPEQGRPGSPQPPGPGTGQGAGKRRGERSRRLRRQATTPRRTRPAPVKHAG